MLIVLSRNYESSDACQFLTQFAVTLDPGRCLDLVCRGDGFFLACEDLGRMFDNSFSAFASFFFFFSFFLFEVEINSHTLISLFRPGSVHSGSVS